MMTTKHRPAGIEALAIVEDELTEWTEVRDLGEARPSASTRASEMLLLPASTRS